MDAPAWSRAARLVGLALALLVLSGAVAGGTTAARPSEAGPVVATRSPAAAAPSSTPSSRPDTPQASGTGLEPASASPAPQVPDAVPRDSPPTRPPTVDLLERFVGTSGAAVVDATGFEPIVATHPTEPDTMAVAYQRFGGRGARCGLLAGIRISHDGGRSWAEVARHPWDGTTRSPSFHSAIAWGPGPSPGSARLYWIDTTVPGCDYSRHQVAIAYTDDEGRSWSRLQVQTATPPWIGGFPDITVDRDPGSRGYGTVYAVYNWPGRVPRRGPGLRLLASRDFGGSWQAIEIGPAPSPSGGSAAWRLGYRVRPAGDGAYVSWFQADLRRWDPADFFDRGGAANVSRAGLVISHVRLDPLSGRIEADAPAVATTVARNGYTVGGWSAPGTLSHSYPDPTWSHGLDVDPATGRVYLAVGDYAARAAGGARGAVRIGTSDDGGRTWRWTSLTALSVGGRPASPFRPSLAVVPGAIIVGMHWIADRTGGSPLEAGEAYAVLTIDGGTLQRVSTIPGATWPARALANAPNGPGLRDRVAATADGRAVFAYGDGREAALRGSTNGPASVLIAVIALERPPARATAR